MIERRGEKRTQKTTRKGKQNGTENEELAKVVARREEKWKENVETEQKEKREGTAWGKVKKAMIAYQQTKRKTQ